MPLRTTDYSSRIPTNLNIVVGTVLGRVVLNNFVYFHTVLLSLQLDGVHNIHVEVVSSAYIGDRTVGEVLVGVSYPHFKPKSINDAIQLSDEIFDSLKIAIQNYLNFSSRYMTRPIPFSIDVDRPPRVFYATFYRAGVSLTGTPMVDTSTEFKYVVELHMFSYYANIVEDYQVNYPALTDGASCFKAPPFL